MPGIVGSGPVVGSGGIVGRFNVGIANGVKTGCSVNSACAVAIALAPVVAAVIMGNPTKAPATTHAPQTHTPKIPTIIMMRLRLLPFMLSPPSENAYIFSIKNCNQ
jgi:hypothetical protein